MKAGMGLKNKWRGTEEIGCRIH